MCLILVHSSTVLLSIFIICTFLSHLSTIILLWLYVFQFAFFLEVELFGSLVILVCECTLFEVRVLTWRQCRPPGDIWQYPELILVVTTGLKDILLASSEQRPGMLFDILQETKQPHKPHNKKLYNQNVRYWCELFL